MLEMKDAFYFILKGFFALKIFKFLSWPFGHVEKRLDWKDKVIFKISDVMNCEINDYHTPITQYLKR